MERLASPAERAFKTDESFCRFPSGLGLAVLLVLCALGWLGCGGGTSSTREKAILDRSKAEFADEGRTTYLEMLRERHTVSLVFPEGYDRIYRDCVVGKQWVFDHLKLPMDSPEYWAVELEFAGREVLADNRVEGTAMMVYVNVLVAEGKREDFLAWVMTAITPEEKGRIEEYTREIFANLRKSS